MSLAEIRQLFLAKSLDLAASRMDTAIASGAFRQARLLRFNPSLGIVAPTSGKAAEPEITQEIEIFGQRGQRVAAARAGMQQASAGIHDVSRRTIGELDRAFYRLGSATRQASLAEEVLALNSRLSEIAGRQLTAGEISRLDYNLAVVELGRSRARALAASRLRHTSSIELARIAGLPVTTVLVPVTDSVSTITIPGVGVISATDTSARLNVEDLVALAIDRRPDIIERAAAARAATARASLARREALPNLLLRGTSQKEPGTARVYRPGVGLTLPVFNFNQGEVHAQRAESAQAETQRAAIVARVRAEITAAAAQFESARLETVVLESTVLTPARQNRQLLETAYREGKVGLPVLLLIRNQVIDAELQYWEAWLAQNEALATLDEALAANTDSLGRTLP